MWKKVALLLASILVVTIIWFAGLQTLYARILVFPANIVLSLGGGTASVSVEKQGDHYFFIASRQKQDEISRMEQQFSTILYPSIMVLAWQLFMVMTLGWKKARTSTGWNLGIFFLSQVFFLLTITYFLTTPGKFLYDMMLENFYIIALAIIIIDSIRNPVFLKSTATDKP